ncbi:polysaccharide deacetylase family protein [Pirellulaceae bacterium SH449]
MNHSTVRRAESQELDELATRFAFDGELGRMMRDFFLRDMAHAKLSAKFKLYYRLRPFIPVPLRQLLQRERNQRIEAPDGWYLPTEFVEAFRATIENGNQRYAIHPWPDDYHFAVVLTHDVETKYGVELVDRLAALEEKYGMRSAWNFVPYKYDIDPGLIRDLQARGHEIGVHGYNHDGRLFESRRTFDRRTKPINDALRRFESVGFRAPMVHRNLKWLQALEIAYDCSCFDIDPFQAMPGGVGSVWPFIVGKFVELPYTLPQDHTLLISLGETTARVWIDKLSCLKSLSGMAMLITHPDYLDVPERLRVYESFLQHLQEQANCWLALPSDIVRWWRTRDLLHLRYEEDRPVIQGELSARAKLLDLRSIPSIPSRMPPDLHRSRGAESDDAMSQR